MWVHDAWKGLQKDVVEYIDCKKHSHSFIQQLKSTNWLETGVQHTFVDCVRRKVLAPFLFMELYPKPIFTLWGKSCGLLPKDGIIADGKVDEETRRIINLVDGIAFHTSVILMVMLPLCEKCDYVRDLLHKEKRKCYDLSNCYNIDDAVKCLRNDEIYRIIRSRITEKKISMKMIVAACAISSVMMQEMLDSDLEEQQNETLSNREEKMKSLGNSEYKEGEYIQAIASYTKIIKTRHYNSIIYNNRALAFLKLKKWAEAEIDGHRTVVLAPTWCKGYHCFVQALEGQNFVHEAHNVATFGVNRCCTEDCAQIDQLSENMLRLLNKCNQCSALMAESKKSDNSSKRKNSSSDSTNGKKSSSQNDVPDLVTDSGSDEDTEQVFIDSQLSSLKSSKKLSSLPRFDTLIQLLTDEWKKGSQALLAHHYAVSLKHFQSSYNFISLLKQQNHHITDSEVVILNYSQATSHIGIGGTEDLNRSVLLLEEIINKKSVQFPCAYQKLGMVLYKMNKFEEAIVPLTNGLSVIEKDLFFPVFTWLGTDIIIEETKKGILKNMIQELIHKCRYPPSPEAVCRFEKCTSVKNIFYSDPDFKGFCRVSCQESCRMEYHPHCWKAVKDKHGKKEKDFLGTNCLTPDCASMISEIDIIDKEGLPKKFIHDLNPTKPKDKQRKSKLEKKLELKAKKKQKKQEEKSVKLQNHIENEDDIENEDFDKSNSDTISDVRENAGIKVSDTLDKPENLIPDLEKENISPNPVNTKLYEDNAEPLYVIKKETENSNPQLMEGKQQKSKKKPKRGNVMSLEEFCGDHLSEPQYYNEYMNRVKKLQLTKELVENEDEWVSFCKDNQSRIPELDPLRPFYVPEDLRNNPETLESILQFYGRIHDSKDDRQVRENIYSYMQDYLEEQGPMEKDSLALQNEVEMFPYEAQQMIAKSDGIVNFLLESIHFAEVKNRICVMKDLGKAYSMPHGGEKYGGAYSLDSFDDFEIFEKGSENSNRDGIDEIIKNYEDKKYSKSQVTDLNVSSQNCDNNVINNDDQIIKKCMELVEKSPSSLQSRDLNASRSEELCDVNENGCEEDKNNVPNCNFSSSTIRKLSNTVKQTSAASQFQLQVLIRSLSKAQQQSLLLTSLNSFVENSSNSVDQLQYINKRISGFELKIAVKTLHKNSQTDKVIISAEEVDTDIYLNLQTLKDENKCLQERITDAEDTVVRLQNQHSMKVKGLEKENADLQQQVKEMKMMINALEVEREVDHKRIQQETKQTKQIQKDSQHMNDKLSKQVEELTLVAQEKTKECEKLATVLLKERDSVSNLQESLSCMLENTDDVNQQLAKAEKGFVELQKLYVLLKIDEQVAKCTDLLRSMEEEIQRCGSAPLLTTAFSQPIEDAKKHLQVLECTKADFLKLHEEQIKALKNGESPSFDPLFPTILEMPPSLKPLLASGLFQMPKVPLLPNPLPGMYCPPGPPRMPFPMPLQGGIYNHPRYLSVPYANSGGPPGLSINRPQSVHGLASNPLTLVKPVQAVNNFPKKEILVSTSSLDLPLNSTSSDEKQSLKTKVATADSLLSASSYDKLTPIPLTSYDSLCDISVEAKDPEAENCGSGTLFGAVSKMPLENQSAKATGFTLPMASNVSQLKGPLSSYDKLLSRLQLKFPDFPREKFDEFISIFRYQNNNKLSDISMSKVVDGVTSIIETSFKNTTSRQKRNPLQLLNMKPTTNQTPIEDSNSSASKPGPAWDYGASKKMPWKSENDSDKSCCICFEEMSSQSMCKVDCGHSFHSSCVKEWLKKDSTCPLCRVYILLPEEFPTLG